MSSFSWMGLSFALAALGAALVTPLVIRVAWRLGAVARPRPDRWNQRPTAMLGGAALYVASVTAASLVLPRVSAPGPEGLVPWLGLWAAATVVFVVGLLDDRRGLGPCVKLAAQAAAAALLILLGVHVPCVASPWLSAALTIVWVIGITNAVNLLDNMDGVAAGVVAIAALALAMLDQGKGEVAVLALCLAGACGGFLRYNFHPARIFMGDCGSLFLGFCISALSLMVGMRHEGNVTASLVAPVAVLALPIFDTTLVIVSRRRHGRPVMQGGRDHTSHRLAALGLPERSVALLLYAGGAIQGAVALAALRLPPLAVAAVGLVGLAILARLGVLLGKVAVYAPTPTPTAAVVVRPWRRSAPVPRRPTPGQPQLHPPSLQEPSV
jgi:UDP-GlcNAc:undecaprenyl-phosphate/decaprenyl-phosphate GlcNAc-1-phosphate transferase